MTDHKPFFPILNDYPLDKLDNHRLLRLRLNMQWYAFTARCVPGKSNTDADALSRAPTKKPEPADKLAEGPASFSARFALISAIGGSYPKVIDRVLKRVEAVASTDVEMQPLKEQNLAEFSNEKQSASRPPAILVRPRPLGNRQHRRHGRRRIPNRHSKAHRSGTLRDLLRMHQGATKVRQRAPRTVYWPNMDVDIVNATRNCEECCKRLPFLPPEPLKATRPIEQLHAD